MVQINGTTRCKEVFIHGKNDIPAEQPLEKTDPRFPCSYENKSRPYCSEEKKSKGQKGIKCLIKKSARRGWGIHCPALLVSDRTGITVGSTDPANVSAIGPGTRMGFVTTKKIGHAFARNRARRLMKEVYRLHMAELSPHYEVVMLSGIFLTGATYQQAEKAILSLWRKAGILVK